MRFVVCLLVLVLPASARGDTYNYIKSGHELRYLTVESALPVTLLAPQVLAVAARRSVSAPSLLGRAAPRPMPVVWRFGLPTSASLGKTPLAARRGRRGCKCKTSVGDTARRRIAAVYATARFDIGAERKRLRVLQLRARYRDGIAVYLNGREVARRNLDKATSSVGLASRTRGPEWETFYIPVTAKLLRSGHNVLAVEVRPGRYRLAPRLDLRLSATTGVRIVRGPVVQRVGSDSAAIVFDTDLPARALVEYGASKSFGKRSTSAGGSLAVHHVVRLRRLPAHKPVHYRVVAGGDISASYRFHTARPSGDPIRFAVYGDVRGGHSTHKKIVDAVIKEAPDFVVVTGDLVMRGSDEADWQRFFGVAGSLLARIPYYPVAGNHDTGRAGDEKRRMRDIFALWPGPPDRSERGHWYSFDVAGVHFVMLDSNSYKNARQLRWVERDLKAAKARGVRAIFAAVHDGPYSRGLHTGNRYAARRYAPLLARHGVTILFSGHDHLYQRGRVRGLNYIVSGGGGAPLYSISCGVRGRRRCKKRDGAKKIVKAHHYIIVHVFAKHVRVCPKRPDGSRLERCLRYKI